MKEHRTSQSTYQTQRGITSFGQQRRRRRHWHDPSIHQSVWICTNVKRIAWRIKTLTFRLLCPVRHYYIHRHMALIYFYSRPANSSSLSSVMNWNRTRKPKGAFLFLFKILTNLFRHTCSSKTSFNAWFCMNSRFASLCSIWNGNFAMNLLKTNWIDFWLNNAKREQVNILSSR